MQSILDSAALIANPIPLSFPEAFRFLCFSFLLFYCPGSFLLHLSRYPLKRGEAFCFSWILGFLWTVTVYALLARFWETGFFPALMAAVNAAYWIFYFRQDLKSWRQPYDFRLEWLPYGACLVFLAVFPWIAAEAWSDFGPAGLKLTGVLHSDSLLGTAVAGEMKTSIPPENPMLGGDKLLYHYFPFIALTIFSKYFSVPLLSLSFVYFQILSQSLFFLTVLVLACRIFKDPRMRFAAVFLTVFAGNLEFKIGYAIGSAYFFWGLCFFSEFLEKRAFSSLFFCSLLWGALVSSLNVLALMVLPALFLLTLLAGIRRNEKTIPLLQLSGGVLAAYFIGYFLSFQPGDARHGTEPLLRFGFPLAIHAEKYLGVFSPEFPEFLFSLKRQLPQDWTELLFRKMNLLRLLFIYGVQALAFLALSAAFLDLALAGFFSTLKSFWKKDFLSSPSLNFTGLTGTIGVLSSWFLQWKEADVTLVYYLMSYGLLLFYATAPLFAFFRSEGRRISKILLWIVILYTLSHRTVGKIAGFRNGYASTLTSSDLLSAYAFLKKEVPAADWIIHPLVHDEPRFPDGIAAKKREYRSYLFPVLTERRSFFIQPPIRDAVGRRELSAAEQERWQDWETFFSTENAEKARTILEKYKISWVVSTRENSIRFSPWRELKPVHQNGSVTVFFYEGLEKTR